MLQLRLFDDERAANDPAAASERNAAASQKLFPVLTSSPPLCSESERLEKGVVEEPTLCVVGRKAPPGRDVDDDHWDARYRDLAVACRPIDIDNTQVAIVSSSRMQWKKENYSSDLFQV